MEKALNKDGARADERRSSDEDEIQKEIEDLELEIEKKRTVQKRSILYEEQEDLTIVTPM